MKTALEAQGFENVFVMPNCKKLDILTPEELVYHTEEPYPLCTFSRVMKEKGIEDAVEAVRSVNEKLGRTAYTLDIYGQVDTEQTQWFEALKNTFPDYIRYMGVVPYDQSVSTLKNYFALLFPTYYDGEGFAGTLIDAFAAGVPVIASDWKYNSEIVNKHVGYIYPAKSCIELANILSFICLNPNSLCGKKSACLDESRKYDIGVVVEELIEWFLSHKKSE